MNILKHKKILKGLGQQTDLLNTLGGGVSMAQIVIKEKKDSLEVRAFVPGLGPEAMQVVLDQNRLILLGILPDGVSRELPVPLFQQVIELPFQVDVAGIRARFRNRMLQVSLPFAAGRSQGARAIEIER
jgi:HSP20 family protein